MIENMKVELGKPSDIDSWMQLVRKVSWNFPGLETEQRIEEHKMTVLKFMNDKRALCVKNGQDIAVGVTDFERVMSHNEQLQKESFIVARMWNIRLFM